MDVMMNITSILLEVLLVRYVLFLVFYDISIIFIVKDYNIQCYIL